jgi:putative hydrolase of the HAD superfamily
MQYTHIFFDLDHTLWDYDTNARAVLAEIYDHFELQKETFHGPQRLTEIFFKVNDGLWQQYNQGQIDRDAIRKNRFAKVLEKLNIYGFSREAEMNEYFLFQCPRQNATLPGTHETLTYLAEKYHLSIVTNGFDDVQGIKLEAAGLSKYFQEVFTSETTGFKKPSREIFDFALQKLNCSNDRVLMIGDNLSTDIAGAKNAGITPIFYNPNSQIKVDDLWQVSHLSELTKIL